MILDVYAQKVALGEWRDYAISFEKDQAVFAVFKRSKECPIFSIHKTPNLAHKQGQYSVMAGSGYTLKRGQNLKQVMAVLSKPTLVS